MKVFNNVGSLKIIKLKLQSGKAVTMEQLPDAQEDAILKMMERVDNSFERRLRKIYLSRKIDSRHYLFFISPIYYIALFVIIAIPFSLIARTIPTMGAEPPSTQVPIYLSLIAAFIALASLGVNIQKVIEPINVSEILVEYNYKVLKENLADENLALLRGLIVCKSKYPDLSLKDVLDLPITKDKLFEILYK
jgi:hypothetical protein